VSPPLLQVQNLKTTFDSRKGPLTAVDGLSFDVHAGETLAIVGESGSGKSVTAMSIMRLLRSPPARYSGKVMFEGQDLLALPEAEMRKVRGARISMIFQEPMSSLNPVMTIGAQIAETIRLHQKVSPNQARDRALELLTLVGIPAPERRLTEFPHKLSGGMRQRVMIAMALACDPALLIADEPTTALDVTIQAQILDLLRSLKDRLNAAVILITHDLGVVAELADRVVVMYAGRKVEEASCREIFAHPKHPYTRGMIGAAPRLGSSLSGCERGRLVEIPGSVPGLADRPKGCGFAPRCGFAGQCCADSAPDMTAFDIGHQVACHKLEMAPAA
jgi:peptide/nickel transport system ATP-binding protein